MLKNAGWKWQALNPDKPMTEEQAIRCAPALLGPCSSCVKARVRGGCWHSTQTNTLTDEWVLWCCATPS